MIESRAPWKLAKDPALAGELRATLADAMAVLELVLQEVECVIPDHGTGRIEATWTRRACRGTGKRLASVAERYGGSAIR